MSTKQIIISLIALILIGFPLAKIFYLMPEKNINKILMLASSYIGIVLLLLAFGREE